MKHREKYRMPRPDLGQLELAVEPVPRRVLDLESLARLHRDFAGKGKRPRSTYQRRHDRARRSPGRRT